MLVETRITRAGKTVPRITLLADTTVAYLYRLTQISTGKWYEGSRTAKGCHPNDGYICSSNEVQPMVLANPNDWKREILLIGNPKYIRAMEEKRLISLDAKRDPMSFNCDNANGTFSVAGHKKPMTEKVLKHLESLHKKNKGSIPWNKGLTKADDKRLVSAAKKRSELMLGSSRGPHTEQTKQKIAATERVTKQMKKNLKGT